MDSEEDSDVDKVRTKCLPDSREENTGSRRGEGGRDVDKNREEEEEEERSVYQNGKNREWMESMQMMLKSTWSRKGTAAANMHISSCSIKTVI